MLKICNSSPTQMMSCHGCMPGVVCMWSIGVPCRKVQRFAKTPKNYVMHCRRRALPCGAYTAAGVARCCWLGARIACSNAQGETVELEARMILTATGAKPNTAYGYEHRTHVARAADGKNYACTGTHEQEAARLANDVSGKPSRTLSRMRTGFTDLRVHLVGDVHPQFHGSVVKALYRLKRL